MATPLLNGTIPLTHDDKPEWFRYGEQAPQRRAAFLLRREVYDREMDRHSDEPADLRMAHCLATYLREKPIVFEDEILAGFYLYANLAYTSSSPSAEVYQADRDGAICSESDREVLAELLNYTSHTICNRGPAGHVIAGYDRLLVKGIGGVLAEIDAAEGRLGRRPFLQAARIVMQGASELIGRYGRRAAELESAAVDDAARAHYGRIARACAQVELGAPRGFFEAVQLLCLLHEVIITEQNSGSLSLGRFDRYLAPFYERDKAAGVLDFNEAARIVEAFFMKMAATPRAFQNLTLGGHDSADGYCCNDLTRICLRASGKLRKDQPLISLRWHPTMPASLWDDVMELVMAGIGFPAIFNDEVAVAAKMRSGISQADAQQYGIVGCVELSVGGMEYSHTEGLRINWAKILELMLNDGRCMLSGDAFRMAQHRELGEIKTFEELYEWFKVELHHFTDTAIRASNLLDGNFHRHWPSPFLSSTMDRCIESGMDVTAGGTRYNLSSINAAGMANAVDSLLAIRRWVFEEKRFTLVELARMMANDFKDQEQFRLLSYNRCQRFGSDPAAAEMMAELAEDYCAFVSGYDNPRGGKWQLGFYTVDWHATMGQKTAASADGRRKGASLANAMSPVQGTERHGPTEVIQSVARSNHACFGNGMVLDLKFHPRFFEPQSHRTAFRHMVETYFEMGGMEIQFNVVDRKTLLAAQENPQQYKDLIVRVSGFSAYFTTLSPAVQNEIIARTEFSQI